MPKEVGASKINEVPPRSSFPGIINLNQRISVRAVGFAAKYRAEPPSACRYLTLEMVLGLTG
jgi:hypothetical protein